MYVPSLNNYGPSFFLSSIVLQRVVDTRLNNYFLPVALVPSWTLLLRQPQEAPSVQRQTPAWEPEEPDSVAVVYPPRTPNPGSKTVQNNKRYYISRVDIFALPFRLLNFYCLFLHSQNKFMAESVMYVHVLHHAANRYYKSNPSEEFNTFNEVMKQHQLKRENLCGFDWESIITEIQSKKSPQFTGDLSVCVM